MIICDQIDMVRYYQTWRRHYAGVIMNKIEACKILKLNHNQVLNLATIKVAYRKLSKKHHPDMGGSNDAMIQINQAYAFLSSSNQDSTEELQANGLFIFNDLFNLMLANYLLAFSRYTSAVQKILP